MPRSIPLALSCALCAALWSGALPAQTDSDTPAETTVTLIDGTDPALIAEVARGFGSAFINRDTQGDPMIEGRIDGTFYRVFFYGCTDGANCTHVMLQAEWANDAIDTLAFLNTWNRSWVFTRAYLGEDDARVILDMTVNLRSGVSLYNLDDTFDWWSFMLKQFRTDLADLPGAPAHLPEKDL